MIDGRGITHSERFEAARAHGAHMHGIQAWVALPNGDEETAPEFFHHEGADLPQWQAGGVRWRLIAGTIDGMHAIYVAAGSVTIDGRAIATGQMAVVTPGIDVDITSNTAATVMALGGEPVGERFLFWNFVSSSRDRIEQAKEDWRQRRMKLPDGDDQEFTPLPEL
jgi:redox-sensitive bicupin YhaK (pirin superfamily)